MDSCKVGDVLYPQLAQGYPLVWVTEVTEHAFKGIFLDPHGGYTQLVTFPAGWECIGHVADPPDISRFDEASFSRVVEHFRPIVEKARQSGLTVNVSWA